MKKTLISSLIVASAMTAAPLHAEQMGSYYLKGAIGQADLEDLESDTSFTLGGGITITDNFAFEVSYTDYGDPKESEGSLSISLNTTALSASVIGRYPFAEKFALYGRLGIANWETDIDASISGLGSASLSEDGTDLVYGVGISAELAENISLLLEYEEFEVDPLDVEGDMNNLLVGIKFSL